MTWHLWILWIWCLPLLASVPDWILPVDFSLEVIPIKESQTNSQYLLWDRQYSVEERTGYEHIALKVLNRFGAEKWSQYRLRYHPDRSTPTMHMFNIYRNGVWSDRLASAKKIVFDEGDCEEDNVFAGYRTIVYLFSDIQPGDILDISYSYAQKGDIPHSMFAPFNYATLWNVSEEAERTFLRLLVPKDPPLQYFATTNLPAPIVREFSSTIQEWIFDEEHTSTRVYESNQPDWYEANGKIFFSQWGDWKPFIMAHLAGYHLPSECPPQEIQQLAYQWMAEASDPKARALAALRFVQDEVHYVSYGGVIPEHPFDVFQMRLGDCKSKTHLLNYLLSLMNIQSCPVIVYNKGAPFFPQLPPVNGILNHVIARITIDGKDYFVDPCYTLQGGHLEDAYTRRLYFGVPVDSQADGPVPIPSMIRRMEVNISGQVCASQEVDVDVTVTYFDFEAEFVRNSLQRKNPKYLEKEQLAILRELDARVTQTTPIEIEDDRLNNRLMVKTSYHFPKMFSLNAKESWAVSDHLNIAINSNRKTPYKLDFPFEIKETIHITGLNGATYQENEIERENDFCSYHFSQAFNGDVLDIQRKIKFLKDHVPVEAFTDFNTFIEEIRETM